MQFEKIRLSSRLDRVKPSITMAVSARAAELRAKGVDVISFGAGEPDFDTPEHIKEATRKALTEGDVSGYTNVRGTPELRQAVVAEVKKSLGLEVGVDNVMVSCGAKHSLFNIFVSLLDDGDEVIVPAPYWVSYPDMVKIAGGNPVIVDTRAEDNFALEPKKLEQAITDKTRALVLNTPSNPTGAIYSRERLEEIAKIAVERDLWVISDDIYRSLVYGDAEYVSITSLGADVAARTILVDGVSKTYAMTGWRIGWTVGPKELISAMAKLQGQSTSGASHVAQVAAVQAITGPQDCVAEMKTAFDGRRRKMIELLRAIDGIECREPQGAFYAFPDISAHVGKKTPSGQALEDDVALCGYLVDEGQIAVVPGSGFGAPGFARLSYACSMENIEQGLSRMKDALAKLS